MRKVYVELNPVNNDLMCEVSISGSDAYELLDAEDVAILLTDLQQALDEMEK